MASALKEHYEVNGIAPRVHGNEEKLLSNTLSKSQVEYITAFISNYAEINAIELPGRIPGYRNDDIKLVSSSETKANKPKQNDRFVWYVPGKYGKTSTIRKFAR